jgi:hypothetical protein
MAGQVFLQIEFVKKSPKMQPKPIFAKSRPKIRACENSPDLVILMFSAVSGINSE